MHRASPYSTLKGGTFNSHMEEEASEFEKLLASEQDLRHSLQDVIEKLNAVKAKLTRELIDEFNTRNKGRFIIPHHTNNFLTARKNTIEFNINSLKCRCCGSTSLMGLMTTEDAAIIIREIEALVRKKTNLLDEFFVRVEIGLNLYENMARAMQAKKQLECKLEKIIDHE